MPGAGGMPEDISGAAVNLDEEGAVIAFPAFNWSSNFSKVSQMLLVVQLAGMYGPCACTALFTADVAPPGDCAALLPLKEISLPACSSAMIQFQLDFGSLMSFVLLPVGVAGLAVPHIAHLLALVSFLNVQTAQTGQEEVGAAAAAVAVTAFCAASCAWYSVSCVSKVLRTDSRSASLTPAFKHNVESKCE